MDVECGTVLNVDHTSEHPRLEANSGQSRGARMLGKMTAFSHKESFPKARLMEKKKQPVRFDIRWSYFRRGVEFPFRLSASLFEMWQKERFLQQMDLENISYPSLCSFNPAVYFLLKLPFCLHQNRIVKLIQEFVLFIFLDPCFCHFEDSEETF